MSRQTLECPICYVPYDNKERYPIVLMCGHSFCFSCSKGYPNNEGACPTCRERFRFPNGFIKPFALLECINLLNEDDNHEPADKKKGIDRVRKSATSFISDQMAFNGDLADRLTAIEEENRATKGKLAQLEEENDTMRRRLRGLENVSETSGKLERMAEELNRLAVSIDELQFLVAIVNESSSSYAKHEDINEVQNSLSVLNKKHDVLREIINLQQKSANRSMQLLQEVEAQEENCGPVPEITKSSSIESVNGKSRIHYQNISSYFRPSRVKFQKRKNRKFEKFVGQWKVIKCKVSGVEQNISTCNVHRYSFEGSESEFAAPKQFVSNVRVPSRTKKIYYFNDAIAKNVPEGVVCKAYRTDGSEIQSVILTIDQAIFDKLGQEGKLRVQVELQNDDTFKWGDWTFAIVGKNLLQSSSESAYTYEKSL